MSDKIPTNLTELSRSQLRKLAKSYKIKTTDEMKRKDLRRLILKKIENENIQPRSKDELIVDFVKSLNSIDNAIEPYKEQRKELKKSYKDNNWLDAKEQKRAIKAFKLLKDRENVESLLNYYKEISLKTSFGGNEDE